MSWAEVKKVNSDLAKPLDELITELNTELETALIAHADDFDLSKEEMEVAIAELKGYLADSVYGLSALQTLLGTISTATASTNTKLDSSTYGLSALKNYLANSTYGLSALKTAISNISTGGTVPIIKSIQRGYYDSKDTSSGNSYIDKSITISSVDITKSIVLISTSTGGDTYSSSSIERWGSSLESITSTSITIHSPNRKLTRVSWQVIEFY